MNNNIHFDALLFTGTVGGTSLVLFINISSGEILKTIVLGVIGALVSFSISLLMKWVVKRLTKK